MAGLEKGGGANPSTQHKTRNIRLLSDGAILLAMSRQSDIADRQYRSISDPVCPNEPARLPDYLDYEEHGSDRPLEFTPPDPLGEAGRF